MKTINNFDRSSLAEMREAINNRLSFLELDYNIKIKLANISFSDKHFTAKLECNLVIDGEVKEGIANDFEEYKELWGLKFPLGFSFHDGNSIYKVVGLKTKNRKYPIICESLGNGKRYKLTRNFVNVKYEEINGSK